MSGILELITQQLGGQNLDQISRSLGTDKTTAGNAVQAALPALIGALSRNASNQGGAQSLLGALQKDHDGSVLDDLSGFLQNQKYNDPRGGQAILNHLLGQRQGRVQQGVSQVSGLDQNDAGKLLSMLAPVVMGALGKQTRQQGLGADGLMSMLSGESRQVETHQGGGIVAKMLDQDGDGDFDASDAAKLGMGLFSSFMKKR